MRQLNFLFVGVIAAQMAAMATPAVADCDIGVRIVNDGAFAIVIDPASIEVRSISIGAFYGGLIGADWRRAQNGGLWPNRRRIRLDPGEAAEGTYEANGSCNADRRIRMDVVCQSGRRQGQTQERELYLIYPTGGGPWIHNFNTTPFCS